MKRMIIIVIALIALTSSVVAQMSDYSPTIRIVAPVNLSYQYQTAMGVPTTVQLSLLAYDPDAESGYPVRWRYIYLPAVLEREPGPADDLWIDTRYKFDTVGGELVQLDNPEWSHWLDWKTGGLGNELTLVVEPLDELGNRIYYLLAFQVMDADGTVSTELEYGRTVHNIYANTSARPVLHVRERYLGEHVFSGTNVSNPVVYDVAQGQPLAFEWVGFAEMYGGTIQSYRWGWDISDEDDPNDPGWAVPPGMSPEHLHAPEIMLNSGLHRFYVDCRDLTNARTLAVISIVVVPIPDAADQRSLLLVDDVVDANSGGWLDVYGNIAYDEDNHRDAFWESTLGSVWGWDHDRDVIDTMESSGWGYREAVEYKTVLWAGKNSTLSYITQQFDPLGSEAYVWLEPYMKYVGNVFMVGGGTQRSFHNFGVGGLSWIDPIIYESEESSMYCSGQYYAMGFGQRISEDGEIELLGLEKFPSQAMGLGMMSAMVPGPFYRALSLCGYGGQNVKTGCAGTKAIILDTDFAAAHAVNDAIADTIMTWATIDHADVNVMGIPNIATLYTFGGTDEFYDTNVTSRTTPWSPQELEDGSPAIEPMWRAYTRYDWIRDQHHTAGNTGYPDPDIDGDMSLICGSWTIDPVTERTRLDGVPLGVFSYKTTDTKPSGKADVLWGFDPSRMDHDSMIQAIHWVLDEHFGLDLER